MQNAKCKVQNCDLSGRSDKEKNFRFFEKKTREPPKLGYARFGEPLYRKKLLSLGFVGILRKFSIIHG